jgi:protein PhnA
MSIWIFTKWEFNESKTDYSEIVLDANGNRLNDSDSIIIIKNLPFKGAPKPLKAGTKVKHIRLLREITT